mmetsp:Transcript_51243/g.91596  ORF Transcript_51243/g.91596 Transcript_51243/m.91596 type:complete len:224 (-) Transcript_51243:59-730(-)
MAAGEGAAPGSRATQVTNVLISIVRVTTMDMSVVEVVGAMAALNTVLQSTGGVAIRRRPMMSCHVPVGLSVARQYTSYTVLARTWMLTEQPVAVQQWQLMQASSPYMGGPSRMVRTSSSVSSVSSSLVPPADVALVALPVALVPLPPPLLFPLGVGGAGVGAAVASMNPLYISAHAAPVRLTVAELLAGSPSSTRWLPRNAPQVRFTRVVLDVLNTAVAVIMA